MLIKNSQRIFFGRYDQTRAKLNTVYIRLTVYSVTLRIYSSKCVGENVLLQNIFSIFTR